MLCHVSFRDEAAQPLPGAPAQPQEASSAPGTLGEALAKPRVAKMGSTSCAIEPEVPLLSRALPAVRAQGPLPWGTKKAHEAAVLLSRHL